MVAPTLVVLPPGAYKNTSNSFLYIYGNDTVTMTDESNNQVDIDNLPTWLPPNFTITPTNSTERLIALKSQNIEDFAGFLSSVGAPTVGAVLEATVSTYAQVYTTKALTSAVATANPTVDNSGNVIQDLNNATVDTITVGGVKTNDATHTSGGPPVSQGAQSVGGSYVVYISDQQKGFNFWKNGTFATANLSSLVNSPTRVAISPNGKYVALVDTTASTVELWVGS